MTNYNSLTEGQQLQLENELDKTKHYIRSQEARIYNAQQEILVAVKDMEKAAKKNDFTKIRQVSRHMGHQYNLIGIAESAIEMATEQLEEQQQRVDGFGPIVDYLQEIFEKDMEWHAAISEKIAGMSFKEAYAALDQNQAATMLAKMTTEEARTVFHNDAKGRLAKLRKQIEKVVGTVKEFKLHRNENFSMDGYVIGDNGTASIQTFGAGGYNIQRFHYRTKVKAVKFEGAK